MAQHKLADYNRVIFINIKFILIMQKLYNLFFYENSVIVFYKNNLSTYLVILSDFNDLKLEWKILEWDEKKPKQTNKLDEIQDIF